MITLCTPFELTSSAQRRPSLGHCMTTLRPSFSYEDICPGSEYARM